jgi:hypothetical protein
VIRFRDVGTVPTLGDFPMLIRLSSSPELKQWHPYDTALETVMRRLVVGIWQIREITPEELRAHIEQRQSAWLREAGIHQNDVTVIRPYFQ